MSHTTIVIIRHGQSVYNRDGIVSGHVDPELTELGKRQAIVSRDLLKKFHFDEVYSSDLQRAVHTAEIVSGMKVPKNHQLKELRERTFGIFDGKPSEHLIAQHEKNRSHFEKLSDEDKWRFKAHETVESDHQVSKRFILALEHIALEHSNQTILVAAHGGTIRTSLISLGYAKPSELPSGTLDNAGYAVLTFKNGEFSVGEVAGVRKQTVNNP
jgi:broad specificity phosphatase PhoE